MSSTDYFFSGNQYIRVFRGDTGPGQVNAGYPQPITNWQWPAGFGANGIDAALYSGSKCFFFKGSQYVRVTRTGTFNAGQQDFTAPHPISEWGWPNGFGSDGIDAALWSGPVTYFFKGTQYIRITRGDSDFGTVDAGYPRPLSVWGFPTGFGTNGIKGALYSGAVCYFFDGPNYVRVQRGLVGAGYIPSNYPRRIADVWGWGSFGANGIDAAFYSGGSLVPQPTPITGNNNYWMQANGSPLLGVQVTVSFDEDFVSSSKGFSFQINAVSQPGYTVGFQQFIIWDAEQGTVTSAFADIFSAAGKELLRGQDAGVVTLQTATTVPKGYQFHYVLTYNGNAVTGCTYTVTDINGASVGTPQTSTIAGQSFNGTTLTNSDLAPIVAFAFNIGGEVGGATSTIAQGAAGTITYTATTLLTPGTEIDSTPFTVENANILFGQLPANPNQTFAQGFRAA